MKSPARRKAPVPPGVWSGVGALLQQQRRGGAERQFRQARAAGNIAVAADVALGGFLLDQALLGGFRAQDRGRALGILVDTDAEVQLVRARIVAVGVEQAQDRVARYAGDMAK